MKIRAVKDLPKFINHHWFLKFFRLILGVVETKHNSKTQAMSKQTQIYRLVQEDANISKIEPLASIHSKHDANHVQRRQQQRAINSDMIQIALTYGAKDYSHGAVRFTLTDRILNHTPYKKVADCLRGLRVVCKPTETTTEIITAYWDTKTKKRVR